MDEEEIPLTTIRSAVTEATRSRFDSLLQAALSGDQIHQKKKTHKQRIRNAEPIQTSPSRSKSSEDAVAETVITSVEYHKQPLSVEMHHRSHITAVASRVDETKTGNDDDDDDGDVQVQNKIKPKNNLSSPSRDQHHHSFDDEEEIDYDLSDDDDETVLVSVQNERARKSVKQIIIKGSSLEASPQHSSMLVDNDEIENEVPQRGRRPVPLPRIKTGKITDNVPKIAVRHVFDIPRELVDDDLASHVLPSLPDSKLEESGDIIETEETHRKKTPPPKPKRKTKTAKAEPTPETKSEEIIGIYVHRSDQLQPDFLVQHPLIKVHLIDAETGEYLKKSNRDRSVSFYYENKEVDYIQPLMTEIFDFRKHRSVLPHWEELLIFNEDVNHILDNDPPVIIMFEILDFVDSSTASSNYTRLGPESGWHKVAWAFLRPVGANGHLNVDRKLRLQLYKPQRTRRSSCDSCDVYLWWSDGLWDRYPGSLYVTVRGITPPDELPAVLRSRVALQQEFNVDILHGAGEVGKENILLSKTQAMDFSNSVLPATSIIAQTIWSRLPAQSCKIPNQRKFTLPTGSGGCFTLKFSNSGLLLACAMATSHLHPIVLFTIPEGKPYIQFTSHQGLVYELNWSSSDTMLLSASSDCTVCIWDVENKKTRPVQMLPHPSFVYCAQFRPSKSWLLASGCFDHVIRLWKRNHTAEYELVQELYGHKGYVSSLCFDRFGTLISGDSEGCILVWAAAKMKKRFCPWKQLRDMNLRELRGTVLNKLMLHPGGQRMLVHARDNQLRMLDLPLATPIQWFKGALNHRVQTSACISPCGGLVLAAGEDGVACVWNADTGILLASYSGLMFPRGVSGIDYHPHEHMVAFSSHGSASRIVVCSYSKAASGHEIGLQLMNEQDSSVQRDSDFSKSVASLETSTFLDSLNKSEFSLKDFIQKKIKPNTNGITEQHGAPSGSQLLDEAENEDSLWSNHSVSMSTQINITGTSNKPKLAEIINKMDEILSLTSSKSGTCISEKNTAHDKSDSMKSPGRNSHKNV